MANDITVQVIEDGEKNTIIKWDMIGANKGGDEIDTVIFDASLYKTASLYNRLYEIWYSTVGFTAILNWAADTPIPLATLANNLPAHFLYDEFGSVSNDTTTGRTGDITITTNNLNDGDSITIILYVKEKKVIQKR